MLLATLICQLRKQLVFFTLWIFVWDLLNSEARHRIVASQNTVSFHKVRALSHAQTNVVDSGFQLPPTDGPPTYPGDCAMPAGVKLYTEPTSSQILMGTSIDGAWVCAMHTFTFTNHRMQQSAHPSSAIYVTAIPGNLQDGVVTLLGERTLHDGCVGGIGLKVHNTLLPVGIEGPVSWESGAWES